MSMRPVVGVVGVSIRLYKSRAAQSGAGGSSTPTCAILLFPEAHALLQLSLPNNVPPSGFFPSITQSAPQPQGIPSPTRPTPGFLQVLEGKEDSASASCNPEPRGHSPLHPQMLSLSGQLQYVDKEGWAGVPPTPIRSDPKHGSPVRIPRRALRSPVSSFIHQSPEHLPLMNPPLSINSPLPGQEDSNDTGTLFLPPWGGEGGEGQGR